MFFQSNTQIAAGAANRLVASLRLGRMLAALIAVSFACAALAASPAMASTESLDSRATATEKCAPPGYDPKESDQSVFEAAVEKLAFCVSTVDPKGTSPDDPKGDDASAVQQRFPIRIWIEFGTSTGYQGIVLVQVGHCWNEWMYNNDGSISHSAWHDLGGTCP